MEIFLNQVVPEPLAHLNWSSGDIWSKNLSIPSGEIVHVCAPSGTGKTTLIHLLYGLRKDFSGELKLGGENFYGASEDKWQSWRLKSLSIIFQDLKLFEDLTAWENLILKNQLTQHLSLDDIHNFAGHLGVDHLLNKKIKFISRGERQRIAIIRSLCMPFEFLLMDEPFSHLDDRNATLAAELILQQAKKNNAGLILANLEPDSWFPYQLKLKMN